MDVLFLHVPKFNNYYKPINRFVFILYPSMGLLGLADYLRKNHCSTEIVHLGVERNKYGKVDTDKLIAETHPAIVGLDLHWHFQSYDVIEVARKIKQAHPEIAIVLGGFTASFFSAEILRECDCVDFIVRGDAEIPLLDLVTHYRTDKAYGDVPNLAFRENGKITANPVSYVAGQAMLDSISYTDFTLMKDYPTFVDSFSRYMNIQGLSETAQSFVLRKRKGYPVFLGRGCVKRCSYCGGSIEAQTIINNRTGVCLRSVEQVLASLQDLQRFGFDFAYLNYDPLPGSQAEDFYLSLFEGMRRLHISLSLEIERWSVLPSRQFLQALRDSAGKGSCLSLTLNSPNEDLRRRNGFYWFSNEELEECLATAGEEGVNCLLFFACGLPFETKDDLKSLALYQKRLRRKFKHVKCKTCAVEIEPGSELSMNPEAYGIKPLRSTFMDYYRYHRQPSRNHFHEIGYDRSGCPSQEEVRRFFCRHFCDAFKAGALSPLLCGAVAAMWKLGAFRLADRLIASGEKRKQKATSACQ